MAASPRAAKVALLTAIAILSAAAAAATSDRPGTVGYTGPEPVGMAAAAAADAAAGERAAGATAAQRARLLPSDDDLAGLEADLQYNFTNKWLLREALIHPSFGEWNNARLTWLGDAVLGATVSDLLYQALSRATTEALHGRRMALVRREACAAAAQKLKLDQLLVVGKGFEGQVPTMHMLAEAFEAIWGAIFADRDFHMQRVKEVYASLYPLLPEPGVS